MSVERFPMNKINSDRSKSPPDRPRPQPNSSAVQINKDSEVLEVPNRASKGSENPTQTSAIPPNGPNAHRTRARIQFANVCFSLFLVGWNDGTTGPLLPRIQHVYYVCEMLHCLSNVRKEFSRLDLSLYLSSLSFLSS